jgi:pimeloyl-ACP methyl ester carboxylesterase
MRPARLHRSAPGTGGSGRRSRALLPRHGLPADGAVEPLLRRLDAPTLIVWGTADPFFDIKWAHWLRETIPGARPIVELPDAKLFFPYEHPARFAAELRRHWHAAAGATQRAAGAAINATL